MKTFKFFAFAAAVVAAVSCNQGSNYDSLVKEAMADNEIKKLEVTSSSVDSVSYLLGANFGLMFKGNGFFDEYSDINLADFKKGISDAMGAGEPDVPYGVDSVWAAKFKISPYEMNRIINEYLGARRAYQAALNEKIGEKFLAENAKKAGVTTTKSGLQYKVLVEGKGAVPTDASLVKVKYEGRFINGEVFDSNMEKDGTLDVKMEQSPVIQGWMEVLKLMPEGSKWEVYLPYNLAYGEHGSYRIEPFSALIFTIEIIDVIG